jgi:GNAT superfamily N-acetyltransferase
MSPPTIPSGYTITPGYPDVDTYRNLRRDTGLSPKSVEQAKAVISGAGSWYALIVTHVETNQVVGMGRVIGDGAWYFHIADMAVRDDHQRKGLGNAILGLLLQEIEEKAPDGPYVNLVADYAGRKLYAKHGFMETAPGAVAMEKRYGHSWSK